MKKTIVSALTLAVLGLFGTSCTDMKHDTARKDLPPEELAVFITESVNDLNFDDVAPYTAGSLQKAVKKHAEAVPDMDDLKKAVKEKDVKTIVKAKAGMTGKDMTDKEAADAAKQIEANGQTDVVIGEMEGFIASAKDMKVEVVGAEINNDFAEVECKITRKTPQGNETAETVWYFIKDKGMWYNVAEEDYVSMKSADTVKKSTPGLVKPDMKNVAPLMKEPIDKKLENTPVK